MVDLVVARTLRILALTPESDLWQPRVDGHEAVLALLAAGDRAGAVQRYRDIYAEARTRIERLFLERA
jgi:DNA-binding GntR family transcriptional regulator